MTTSVMSSCCAAVPAKRLDLGGETVQDLRGAQPGKVAGTQRSAPRVRARNVARLVHRFGEAVRQQEQDVALLKIQAAVIVHGPRLHAERKMRP